MHYIALRAKNLAMKKRSRFLFLKPFVTGVFLLSVGLGFSQASWAMNYNPKPLSSDLAFLEKGDLDATLKGLKGAPFVFVKDGRYQLGHLGKIRLKTVSKKFSGTRYFWNERNWSVSPRIPDKYWFIDRPSWWGTTRLTNDMLFKTVSKKLRIFEVPYWPVDDKGNRSFWTHTIATAHPVFDSEGGDYVTGLYSLQKIVKSSFWISENATDSRAQGNEGQACLPMGTKVAIKGSSKEKSVLLGMILDVFKKADPTQNTNRSKCVYAVGTRSILFESGDELRLKESKTRLRILGHGEVEPVSAKEIPPPPCSAK